jgi:hypothetical protein
MPNRTPTYEVRKPGLKAKAEITRLPERKAREVFGKAAKEPDKLIIEVYANINGWEGRIGTIPKPKSKYISPKSKMAAFIKRYQQPVEVGLIIDAATNAKGYWNMVL